MSVILKSKNLEVLLLKSTKQLENLTIVPPKLIQILQMRVLLNSFYEESNTLRPKPDTPPKKSTTMKAPGQYH
jgi:hypothetical protein